MDMIFKTLEELQAHNKKVLEESFSSKFSNQEQPILNEDELTHFERITLNSKPHHIFNLDWSTYYSVDFADTFLPKVEGHQCKGVRFYDGAELINDSKPSPRKLLALNDNNKLISIVTYTYPKNVEAGLKKDRVQPSNSEVCAFIEVDQNENAEISFKLGSDFKIFLEKQNINPNQIQNQTFKSDFDTIKNHFNKTLSHDNMMTFVLEKVGVETEKVYGNTNKGKLETFLRDNNIDSFIYKNKCDKDKYIAVQGTIIDGWLELKHIAISEIDKITGLKLADKDNFVVFNRDTIWSETGLTIPVDYNNGNCSEQDAIFTDTEIEHISEQIRKQHKFTTLKGNEKLYNAINNEIQKKLANPFYKSVNLCVSISVADDAKKEQNPKALLDNNSSKSINLNSNKDPYNSSFSNNEGECEITIEIKIDANGKPTIKNIVNPNYLKEFENKWKTEAKRRGLDVNIADLRKQVHTDLENIAKGNEDLSFYKKFVQETKALLSDNIGNYVEAIAATQKIAKNVWAQGTINESTWHAKDFSVENKQWPKYCQFQPVIGGVQDGAIDEIVGIPMAIKGIYEIVTDDEKQKALKGMFTKEGMGKLYEGLKTEVKDTYNDSEKGEHFAGQTTVSVISMMSGVGLLTKANKLVDGVENITDAAQVITNPKLISVLEELKKAERYKPEILNAIQGFFKELNPDLLSKIAKIENFDIVLKEMAQQWKKFHGSKFMFKNLEAKGDDFIAKIDKFEAKIIDEANFTADVKLTTGGFVEYKSWKKETFSLLNGEQAKNQLKNYLKSVDFEYVIDKQKLLKDGIIDPDVFVKEKFQRVFKENAENWFKSIENGGEILDKNSLLNLFGTDKLFEIKILLDDIESEFYKKTIKIE